jgi:nucleotide-binding universal stress UspA family protein
MATKPVYTAVERYLAEETQDVNSTDTPADRAAREARLMRAQRDLQREAAASERGGGIRRILAAVDHENHPALEAALTIALPLRAQIAIVYVLEPLPAPTAEMVVDMTPAYEESHQYAKAMLAKCEREVPANALAFTLLREGPAADEIVAAAKDFNADMIIIGTHRRGALARFFLGSTSQAVVRHATCPVMLVSDVPSAVETPRELQTV